MSADMMKSGVHFTSKTDDWATPQYVVDFAARRFGLLVGNHGGFDLDVCASDSNHKAPEYYTANDDGLQQAWSGNVWLNPPYGRVIGDWVNKAVESVNEDEEEEGGCESVTLLIPARTETRWFFDLISQGAEVIFIKGRLKFGGGSSSAPFPSALVHLKQTGSFDVKTTYEVVE
jgi:phage N-6-adenine-methyltransferase